MVMKLLLAILDFYSDSLNLLRTSDTLVPPKPKELDKIFSTFSKGLLLIKFMLLDLTSLTRFKL